jgi:tRNA pseudouridine38-40 synthase
VTTVAAGRTDAGVHAAGQVVTFRAPHPFAGDLTAALNAQLPEDMAVLSAVPSRDGHARRDAGWKTYRYTVFNRSVRPVLGRAAVHWIARPLDVPAMARSAQSFQGKKDFAFFAGRASRGLPTLCRLKSLSVTRDGERIYMDITADRFLHHMVRRLAGHLVQIGWGEKDPKPLTLPAQGLTLMKVIPSRP